jgi:xylan 1,4-beta-xylosidase
MTRRVAAWVLLSSIAFPVLASAPADPIALAVDARDGARPLQHFWSNVSAGGRANLALRATWLDQWRLAAAEGGFKCVRLTGVLGPGMFALGRNEGKTVFNFRYLDDAFDRIVALNTHLFLELALPPEAAAAGEGKEVIGHFLKHYEDRYGSPELRQWRFELGEGGALSDFELYRALATAVKAVDPALKVGRAAPIAGDDAPLREFLTQAGARAAPVDFISDRYFPAPAAGPDATPRHLKQLRDLIRQSPFPRAELHVTAWNSSSSSSDFTHDSLPAAAWILQNVLASAGLADSLAYRSFADQVDEEGGGRGLFHGGDGLMNYEGIVKPSFHAYRYLNALGDEVIQAVPGGVVSRRKNSGRVVLLAYNCPDEYRGGLPITASAAAAAELSARGSARNLTINLSGLRPGGQILIEMLDATHGNALEAWERMHFIAEPTRPALATLQSGAREMRLEYHQADELGRFGLSRELGAWSVLLLREL